MYRTKSDITINNKDYYISAGWGGIWYKKQLITKRKVTLELRLIKKVVTGWNRVLRATKQLKGGDGGLLWTQVSCAWRSFAHTGLLCTQVFWSCTCLEKKDLKTFGTKPAMKPSLKLSLLQCVLFFWSPNHLCKEKKGKFYCIPFPNGLGIPIACMRVLPGVCTCLHVRGPNGCMSNEQTNRVNQHSVVFALTCLYCLENCVHRQKSMLFSLYFGNDYKIVTVFLVNEVLMMLHPGDKVCAISHSLGVGKWVHKNKSMQHHTLGSGTAEFQVTWLPEAHIW